MSFLGVRTEAQRFTPRWLVETGLHSATGDHNPDRENCGWTDHCADRWRFRPEADLGISNTA
jgi:hypothetical protein